MCGTCNVISHDKTFCTLLLLLLLLLLLFSLFPYISYSYTYALQLLKSHTLYDSSHHYPCFRRLNILASLIVSEFRLVLLENSPCCLCHAQISLPLDVQQLQIWNAMM